jgi:hypothetical protein
LHATAVPQVPFDWQVCTPLPEHCVVPGTHTPVHAPATHALFTQAVVPPKVPFDWQVWTLLPEQVVWVGAHTPVQVPPTHVWLLHAVPTVHDPEEAHVSGSLFPEQLV